MDKNRFSRSILPVSIVASAWEKSPPEHLALIALTVPALFAPD